VARRPGLRHGNLGVTAGVPDLFAWHDGQAFAMEIKSEAGRTSQAQLAMLNKLSEAGVFTAVCHGLDRALAVLESWQLVRGQTQYTRCMSKPEPKSDWDEMWSKPFGLTDNEKGESK
jgi:hypothetical protein